MVLTIVRSGINVAAGRMWWESITISALPLGPSAVVFGLSTYSKMESSGKLPLIYIIDMSASQPHDWSPCKINKHLFSVSSITRTISLPASPPSSLPCLCLWNSLNSQHIQTCPCLVWPEQTNFHHFFITIRKLQSIKTHFWVNKEGWYGEEGI